MSSRGKDDKRALRHSVDNVGRPPLMPPRIGVPTNPVEIDATDRKIIALLQADGRRSFASIARIVGVSEGTARSRVQRLIDSSLVQIVGIADPLRLGFGTMALVGIRVKPGATERVARRLVEIPETSYVVIATGRFDVFAEVVCRNLDEFRRVMLEGIQQIEDVEHAESFVLLEIHKLAYGWGVGEVDVSPTP